jgi:hypothetical protein
LVGESGSVLVERKNRRWDLWVPNFVRSWGPGNSRNRVESKARYGTRPLRLEPGDPPNQRSRDRTGPPGGSRESVRKTFTPRLTPTELRPPDPPDSGGSTGDSSVSPAPASVNSVETKTAPKAVGSVAAVLRDPMPSHELLHVSDQPLAVTSKPAAVPLRDDSAIPILNHLLEPERHGHIAPAEVPLPNDKLALALPRTSSGLVNPAASHVRKEGIMGEVKDEKEHEAPEGHHTNDHVLLGIGSLSDSVTLSELLAIDRALVCELRSSSAANLADALHFVRPSALLRYSMR